MAVSSQNLGRFPRLNSESRDPGTQPHIGRSGECRAGWTARKGIKSTVWSAEAKLQRQEPVTSAVEQVCTTCQLLNRVHHDGDAM